MRDINKIRLLLILIVGLCAIQSVGAKRVLDKICVKYMESNDCYNENRKIEINGIMIHSTACPGVRAREWFSMWNKSYKAGEIEREVCVHSFLDDKDIYQYLPWDHRGWHAGGKANDSYIGIEICEPKGMEYSNDGKDIINYNPKKFEPYMNSVWKKSTDLCADLCEEFDIDPDNIICHYEGHNKGIASAHKDVMHWWPYHSLDMNMFRETVKRKLKGGML